MKQIGTKETIETLLDRVALLVAEQQALRIARAPAAELERNRLELANAQWLLTDAVIARYLPEQRAA